MDDKGLIAEVDDTRNLYDDQWSMIMMMMMMIGHDHENDDDFIGGQREFNLDFSLDMFWFFSWS